VKTKVGMCFRHPEGHMHDSQLNAAAMKVIWTHAKNGMLKNIGDDWLVRNTSARTCCYETHYHKG
jgi:hypothetical protein